MPGAREETGHWGGAWPVALGGLFVFVVAVISLSGPRHIDIIDGQPRDEVARSLVEHGYDPGTTPQVFGCHGFVLERWRRFQFGLNHLFVFRKPLVEGSAASSAKKLAG